MANDPNEPGYVGLGALNTTLYSGWGTAVTVLGGSVIAITKAAGADLPIELAIGALAVVAVGLIALALIVSTDMRARATIKVATIEAGMANPTTKKPAVDSAQNGAPLVEVNVGRDHAEVEGSTDTAPSTAPPPPK